MWAAEIVGKLFEKAAVNAETAMNSKLEAKVFYVKEYEKTLKAMEV